MAHSGVLFSGDRSGEGLSSLALSGAQHSRQSQELSDSFSGDRLSGDASSDFSFESFPDPQTCPEGLISHDRLHILSVSSSCDWRCLLGVMSPMSALVPGARLRMLSLQLRLNVADPRLSDFDCVLWDNSCLLDLQWWSDVAHLQAGLSLGVPPSALVLFTHASDSGWGASLADNHLSGSWSPLFSSLSINHRKSVSEVLHGLKFSSFAPFKRVQKVSSLMTDFMSCLCHPLVVGGVFLG